MKRLVSGIVIGLCLVAMDSSAEKLGWMDTDSDGKVSKDEFFAARVIIDKKVGVDYSEVRAKRLFTEADKNGDGVLTGKEMPPPKPKTPAAQ